MKPNQFTIYRNPTSVVAGRNDHGSKSFIQARAPNLNPVNLSQKQFKFQNKTAENVDDYDNLGKDSVIN